MPVETPLSANGRFIVGADGRRVRLAGVNWYGAHEDLGLVPGLDRTHRDRLARTIALHGFNSVRLAVLDILKQLIPPRTGPAVSPA